MFDSMPRHNIVGLLRRGFRVTINSGDPEHFGGNMNDNFPAPAEAWPMSRRENAQFSLNAIDASFIGEREKQRLKLRVEEFLELHDGRLR